MVNFLFAKEVQHHFELTDGNMFQLISKALALSYGLATVVKIGISGRVLGRFKLKALLLVTPLLLAVAILSHWIIRTTFAIEEQEYLFFVMLMIGSLMLTEAIDNPLVMSLFQPLSKREILGGHTMVKGYAESFGIMLVGASLIWFYSGHDHIDLVVAVPVVFSSAVLWLIGGRRIAGKYLYHLRHLIELKLIKGDQALFLDQDTEHHLKKQLGADDIRVVEQSLEILLVNNRVESRHIKRLLDSSRAEIRSLALSTLEDSNLVDDDLVDYLTEQMRTAEVSEKCRILTVLAGSLSDDEIQRYLRTNDEEAQYSLALGLAKKPGERGERWLKELLEKWWKSSDDFKRKRALHIMSVYHSSSNISYVKEGLKIGSSVVHEAIETAHYYLEDVGEDLMIHLSNKHEFRTAVEAFAGVTFDVLERLRKNAHVTDANWVELMISSGTNQATNELTAMLKLEDPEVRRSILRGLVKFGDVQITKLGLTEFLRRENELLEKLNFSVPKDKLVNNALVLERNEVVERMLGYCYLSTREMVLLNAQKELFLNGENKLALCIEALQASLPLSLFKPIRKVLEARDTPEIDQNREKMDSLRSHKDQLSPWLRLLLQDGWLAQETGIDKDKIKVMKENKVQRIERVLMLRQTALFEEIRDNRLLDIADLMDEISYEKGETIFEKGDKGDSLYVITEGEVAIIDGGHELAKFGKGDFFGDLSLLDPAPRSAAAKATSKTRLLYLDQIAIYEMMYDHIEVVKGILGALCKRIRNQNKVYIEEKNKVSEQL